MDLEQVTKENYKEKVNDLKNFFIEEIEHFVTFQGGVVKASKLLKCSHTTLYTNIERSFDSLLETYEKCLKVPYDKVETVTMNEAVSLIGWTPQQINKYARDGKIKRVKKSLFEKESVEKLALEIKERKKEAGLR